MTKLICAFRNSTNAPINWEPYFLTSRRSSGCWCTRRHASPGWFDFKWEGPFGSPGEQRGTQAVYSVLPDIIATHAYPSLLKSVSWQHSITSSASTLTASSLFVTCQLTESLNLSFISAVLFLILVLCQVYQASTCLHFKFYSSLFTGVPDYFLWPAVTSDVSR
jgi:hypothetical protein